MEQSWALPRAQRERTSGGSSLDFSLPNFERRTHSRGAAPPGRASSSRGGAGLQFARTQPASLRRGRERDTFSHVDFTRKSMRMPTPERGRRKREPQTPSFAAPTGRLRSGRGVGRAAFASGVHQRAQADLEEVMKGTDHLRNIRKQYEQLASTMRRTHTQSSRVDDKRWQDRVGQNREDMRQKLEEARQHFAKELHNDQVSVEREKLKRTRKVASGVAANHQAWVDFEATDWASSAPIRQADIPFPSSGNVLLLGRDPTAAERKAAYREATLRWHPDKFFARWAAFIDPEEREHIVLRIQHVAQLVAESKKGPHH